MIFYGAHIGNVGILCYLSIFFKMEFIFTSSSAESVLSLLACRHHFILLVETILLLYGS